MLSSPLVFVDVDTQRDFLDPAGALYIAGSEAIRPNLAKLHAFARSRGIPVVATACAHLPGDPEFEFFPPHCLLGTPGQSRVPETVAPESLILGVDDRLEPDFEPPRHLTLNKTTYDVFSRPDTDDVFARYDRNKPAFVVHGVATDYCVKAAVLGLLRRNRRVVIVADAIRAVDPAAEPVILTEFVEQGALMVLTETVIG